MRKRNQIFITLPCAVFVVIVLPITANADMGPKASVRIQFENMGDELCYGTLLSEKESIGPASALGRNGRKRPDKRNAPLFQLL